MFGDYCDFVGVIVLFCVCGVTMGKFGQRPYKFDSEEKVSLDIQVDIPKKEYDLLVSYARGLSLNTIGMETNSDYKTIVSVLRRNLTLLLDP